MTEEKQHINKNNRLDHKCLKHNKKVIHRSQNPKISHNFIYPCKECDGKDFEADLCKGGIR
jgi:hypothetical protein